MFPFDLPTGSLNNLSGLLNLSMPKPLNGNFAGWPTPSGAGLIWKRKSGAVRQLDRRLPMARSSWRLATRLRGTEWRGGSAERPIPTIGCLFAAASEGTQLWGLLWGPLMHPDTRRKNLVQLKAQAKMAAKKGVAGFLSYVQSVTKSARKDFQDHPFQPLTHPSA